MTEIDGSPPLTPSSPFIRSYTASQLDNKDSASEFSTIALNKYWHKLTFAEIEHCNGNTEDCPKDEYDDDKIENNAKKNNKLDLFKSLSSAESWESEEDCPPLASEDSDLRDPGEFETSKFRFRNTEIMGKNTTCKKAYI